MKKKKLQLSTIKVKSFTAILPTEQQRTAKGEFATVRVRGQKSNQVKKHSLVLS